MSLNPFTFPESETSEKLDVQEATEFSKYIFQLLTEKFPDNTEVGLVETGVEESVYASLRAEIGTDEFNIYEFGIFHEPFRFATGIKEGINSRVFYASKVKPYIETFNESKLNSGDFPTCEIYFVPISSIDPEELINPDLTHLGEFLDSNGEVQQVYVGGNMEITDAVRLIELVTTDNVKPISPWTSSMTYTDYLKSTIEFS